MSDAVFHIRPAWPESIVYEESVESATVRTLSFDCRDMNEPPQVCVPSAERWVQKVPPWAQPRRELIVERLRRAGCVVVEQGDDVDVTLAPDGSFRIEEHRSEDERTGPWETVFVVGLPEGEKLTWASDRPSVARVRFPAPGIVEMSMVDRRSGGEMRRVRIDPSARTFRFEPGGTEEPLDSLHDLLGWNDPLKPYVAPHAPAPFARLLSLLGALVALVFVAGGVWMALAAATSKERWTGALGAVLFGACAYSSLKSWRSGR